MADIEVITDDLTVTQSTALEIVQDAPLQISEAESTVVELIPDSYMLTSPGIYTGKLDGSVPEWLITAIQTELTTGDGNLTTVTLQLQQAIDNLELGVAQNVSSINTAEASINALSTSVNSRIDTNDASILTLDATKVTDAEATAAAAAVISSTFGGNVDAYIGAIASTYVDENSAIATDIEVLTSSVNGVNASVSEISIASVDEGEARAKHSLVVNADGNIAGYVAEAGTTSEFTIVADTFKVASGTTSYTPLTIDTVNGKVMFNGVVSFQSLTDVPQMVAENTNINITDNLIPTDGWNVDTHADYIWVGDPEYSMAVGAGDFLEAQLVLDANDEVYSPYLEDMTASYRVSFAFKGGTPGKLVEVVGGYLATEFALINTANNDWNIANPQRDVDLVDLDTRIDEQSEIDAYNLLYPNEDPILVINDYVKINALNTTWNTANPQRRTDYVEVDLTDTELYLINFEYYPDYLPSRSSSEIPIISGSPTLDADTWYILQAIVNPFGTTPLNTYGKIKVASTLATVATIDDITLSQLTNKFLLGFNTATIISRVSVVVLTSEAADIDAVDGDILDTAIEPLALSDMSNVTTIDGGKITTNTVNASKLIASTIWTDGNIQSSDFTPYTSGFQLKADAVGTTGDPTIYGAYIKGGTIEGTTMISSTMKVKDLIVVTDADLTTSSVISAQSSGTTLPIYPYSDNTHTPRCAQETGDVITFTGTILAGPFTYRQGSQASYATHMSYSGWIYMKFGSEQSGGTSYPTLPNITVGVNGNTSSLAMGGSVTIKGITFKYHYINLGTDSSDNYYRAGGIFIKPSGIVTDFTGYSAFSISPSDKTYFATVYNI